MSLETVFYRVVGASLTGQSDFRLLSARLSPQAICLEPKPPKYIKYTSFLHIFRFAHSWRARVIERTYEDNEGEAATRRRQAEAAAVDFSWLKKESQKLSYPVRPSPNRLQFVYLPANVPELLCRK